jgi:putative transcriptional regulator
MKSGRKSIAAGQEDGGKDSPADKPADNGPTTPESEPRARTADKRAAPMGKSKAAGRGVKRGFLDGQMLIAMPSMGDERFARAVIYMCAHSADGAMGIIVNQPAAHITFSDLLVQLEVLPAADLIQLPREAGGVKVLKGGPVDTQRGFVLHSADFFIENSTLPIDEGICLTATLDILKAIARGAGPASAVLALGYAGWAPGQLENEIHQNGWLHCTADRELIFGADAEGKYALALKKIGIEVGMLSSEAGHA